MREFLKDLKRSKWVFLGVIIALQTIVYVILGLNKAYIHMDEAYSYGLANYDQVEIVDAPDFYDTWHDGVYYEDYLALDEEERGDFSPVYNNQRDDVHPPLFYLLLRVFMEGFVMLGGAGEFSVWPGIGLNILAAAGTTIFVFLISEKLFRKEKNGTAKALVLTLMAGLTVATLDTVLYIRMYCLLTLMVTVTTYLHLKLLESKGLNWKLLAGISVVALLGVLTQYYYLFYLVALYVFFAVRYIREKRWKELGAYTGALALAGILSLVIWPYSIKHMFFGYRGQGVLSNFADPAGVAIHVGLYLWVISQFVFHGLLPVILIAMMVLMVYGLLRKKSLEVPAETRSGFAMIFVATMTYFLIAAVASPYQTLRYVMAICGMSFMLVAYGLYKLTGMFWREKARNIIMVVLAAVMLVVPAVAGIRPDTLYAEKAELMSRVEELKGAPALYVLDGSSNRFLDDILLFSKFEQSYIAKDLGKTDEGVDYGLMKRQVKEIMAGKNLGEGMVVVINNGQDNERILATISEATGLEGEEWLAGMFACNVYYLY